MNGFPFLGNCCTTKYGN